MKKIHISLDNLADCLPDDLSEAQKAQAKTLFYKQLSLVAHEFYKGKSKPYPRQDVLDLTGLMYGTLLVFLKFQLQFGTTMTPLLHIPTEEISWG